jgi:hypothetical protein
MEHNAMASHPTCLFLLRGLSQSHLSTTNHCF